MKFIAAVLLASLATVAQEPPPTGTVATLGATVMANAGITPDSTRVTCLFGMRPKSLDTVAVNCNCGATMVHSGIYRLATVQDWQAVMVRRGEFNNIVLVFEKTGDPANTVRWHARANEVTADGAFLVLIPQ